MCSIWPMQNFVEFSCQHLKMESFYIRIWASSCSWKLRSSSSPGPESLRGQQLTELSGTCPLKTRSADLLVLPSHRLACWYLRLWPCLNPINCPLTLQTISHYYYRYVILLEKEMATHSTILGNFHGQRSLASYSPWSLKESDTTEHTHTFCHIISYSTL